MVQMQFADLTSGYERFDALAKNLEGIFEKVYAMREYKLDISYYERKLEELKKEFKLKDDFLQNSKMPFESMQKDYEAFTLTECNKSLEKLTNEFEENVTPIYNIYLLFTNIDSKLKNQEDDDIADVISKTIKLIDAINGISSHNKIEVTRLVERAYETVYSSLLYEEIFGRHDILDYLKRKNLSTNRENLGKIIRADVKRHLDNGDMGSNEVDEEFISHMDEGLGYDYLSPEFLNQLSRKSLVSRHEEVGVRQQQMLDYMNGVIQDYNFRRESIVEQSQEHKSNIRNFKLNKAALKGKVFALIMVPVIAVTAGRLTGKALSNRITEYATITRVVDLNTGDIIGEPSMVFDENETTYVATVTVYEPWRKNPTGVGYIRNAVAYEYIVPDEVDENYHISEEDIVGNVREKYRFNEPKDVLGPNDSMTENVIYVTETYQDKSINQKSTKYIVPMTLAGIGLGAFLDIFFVLMHFIDIEDIKRKLSKLDQKIKEEKLSNEDILRELNNMVKEAQSIEQDRKTIEEKYGVEIDTSLLSTPEEKRLQKRH